MRDPRTPRRRLMLLLGGTLAWSALIVARLIDVQVVRAPELLRLANAQHTSTVEIPPPRGAILDRNGVELAVSREVRSIYAVPGLVDSPVATARALARVLGSDRRRLERLLSRTRRDFVWVERKVTDETADAVAALDLKGIGFRKEPKRFYPRGSLAAHVLGFVGLDNKGLAGIEQRYHDQIAGALGIEYAVRDARGVRFFRPRSDDLAVEPGLHVVLTLDASIQHVVERELAAAVAEHAAKKAVAVVLDPWTGDVLAMAGAPTFDPNHYGDAPPQHRRNPAVQEAYEPGSTFKVITFASALEAGRIDLGESIDCGRGKIRIGRNTIRDHAVFDRLTPPEIIQHSSNVGAIRVGARMSKRELHRTILGFGFGQPTGIELPGESRGLLRRPEKWSALSKPSISIGQEIGVTPLQLATAFAAIANGGVLVEPRVVLRLEDDAGRTVDEYRPRARARVISAETARTLNRMMRLVVSDHGTASRAAIDGVAVAGKTGTAQKAIGGSYAAGRYVASFGAFAPADEPRVVVLVAIDEPRGSSHYGGVVAAPVVRRITEAALVRLGVPAAGNGERRPLRQAYPPPEASGDGSRPVAMVARR